MSRSVNLSPALRGLRLVLVGCLLACAVPVAHGADDDISASARLLMAARAADAPAMERALAGGAAINARNRLGESALMVVLKNNHPELAPALMAAGADVNLAAINGLTPLMAAAYIGATDVVRRLVPDGDAHPEPLDDPADLRAKLARTAALKKPGSRERQEQREALQDHSSEQ